MEKETSGKDKCLGVNEQGQRLGEVLWERRLRFLEENCFLLKGKKPSYSLGSKDHMLFIQTIFNSEDIQIISLCKQPY